MRCRACCAHQCRRSSPRRSAWRPCRRARVGLHAVVGSAAARHTLAGALAAGTQLRARLVGPAHRPARLLHPPRARWPQWAIKLFPFGHVPARLLCILGAGDPRFQISEAALEGLHPIKFASETAAAAAAAAAGSDSGAAAGGGARGGKGGPPYPAFEAVLRYLQGHVAGLDRRPPEGASLALPAKVR